MQPLIWAPNRAPSGAGPGPPDRRLDSALSGPAGPGGTRARRPARGPVAGPVGALAGSVPRVTFRPLPNAPGGQGITQREILTPRGRWNTLRGQVCGDRQTSSNIYSSF